MMADVQLEQNRAFGGGIDVLQASYMPPESVVLTKLQAYRGGGSTRHLDDIEGILRVSGPELDLAYIDREAARIAVFGTWRELLEKSRLA